MALRKRMTRLIDKDTFYEILKSYREGKVNEQTVERYVEKEIDYIRSKYVNKMSLDDIDNNHG